MILSLKEEPLKWPKRAEINLKLFKNYLKFKEKDSESLSLYKSKEIILRKLLFKKNIF